METIRDGLRQIENLIEGRATRAEACLEVREKMTLFSEKENSSEENLLKEAGQTRSERDRPVRRAGTGGLTDLSKRQDARKLPGRRKGTRRPEMVKELKKKLNR